LRPPALDELGLVPALREASAQYQYPEADGLKISIFAPDVLPPLPAAVEVAAYRIAQEALTNVVRHARASLCTITIQVCQTEGEICLEVVDDGCGLPALRSNGVGLQSMRERSEELGGTWQIEAVAAGGTRVIAHLPYRLLSLEEA
jgi:two-component system NarL family sensor kinase